MSTIYPERAVQSGDPLDADAINRTLRPFAAEIDGMLGEQNWSSTALTSTTADLETDAVARLYDASAQVNWANAENAYYEPAAAPANSLRVPQSLSWQPIITATLNSCRGGNYEIVFSAQQDAGSISNDADYWARLAGCAYAIRIDGTVYEESMVGGVERNNDPKGEALYWDVAIVDIELHVPLTPGRHVIEVVARQARVDTDTATWASDTFYEVFNRTFYILEYI